MERRLSAIMSADVVGYSRLMGANEVGTLMALKACRSEAIEPAVQAQGGRVFKLVGDGVLVEFSSVVNAVECATAIQEALRMRNADVPDDRKIELRIGPMGTTQLDCDRWTHRKWGCRRKRLPPTAWASAR